MPLPTNLHQFLSSFSVFAQADRHTHTHTQTEREGERATDRQTDRHGRQ